MDPSPAMIRLASLSWLLTAAPAGLLPSSLAAQFCYECYQQRTLRQLLDSFASQPDPADSGFIFRGNDFPSRILLTYTGRERPISPTRSSFIQVYFERVRHQPLAVHFDDELLFLEDSTEYWLAVQSQLVPYFTRELTPGDRVWVYLVWPGGTERAGRADWVFLVNDFQHL